MHKQWVGEWACVGWPWKYLPSFPEGENIDLGSRSGPMFTQGQSARIFIMRLSELLRNSSGYVQWDTEQRGGEIREEERSERREIREDKRSDKKRDQIGREIYEEEGLERKRDQRGRESREHRGRKISEKERSKRNAVDIREEERSERKRDQRVQ